MSTLLLVRHGQATLDGRDYDALSGAGAEQSRLLGRSWAERGQRIDALYTGTMRRHTDTAGELRTAALAGGLELPEPVAHAGFDELDVSALIRRAVERVLPSCPDLLEQLASGAPDERGKLARGHVLGIVGKLIDRWSGGEIFDAIEPFGDFERRVRGALSEVMRAHGRAKRLCVVSSGGPISVVVRMALGTAPDKTAAIMFALENASITELTYTESRLSLTRFNESGHLPPDLVTRI